MASVNGYDANFRNQLELNLNKVSDRAQTGGLVAGVLGQAEAEMYSAFTELGNVLKNPKSSADDRTLAESKVTEQQEKYRSASRLYELFQQLSKNADEIMRRVISNMGLR